MQKNNNPTNSLFKHWLEAFSKRVESFIFEKSLISSYIIFVAGD